MRKSLNLSVIFALIGSVFGASGFCQGAPTAAQNQSDTATVRDPQAIVLLQNSLQAMGGQASWFAIYAADIQGSASGASSGVGTTIHWVDTWKNGNQMRRSRSVAQGNTTNFTSDSTAPATSTTQQANGKKIMSVRYDPVSQLITHLPGAAMTRLLNSRYQLSIVQEPVREHPSDCIQAKRDHFNLFGGGLDVTLCFDKQTHLPSFAYLSVATLSKSSAPLKERIGYSSFQFVNGLSVPQSVAVLHPTGQKTIYTFTQVALNPANPEIVVAGGSQ